jgi:CO dehydrogenase maturation factor
VKPLVAISGKGGTGKTTLAALMVEQLIACGVRPVLAVDADPNACLAELLGVQAPGTIAELKEATKPAQDKPGAMPKALLLEKGLNEILAEGQGFDLLTMGRPEGPGCYCYVNAMLKEGLKRLTRNYAATVIDNQAGMEHISRLVAANIDALLVVAEPTAPAARAARSILELSRALPMEVGRRILVWNKVRGGTVPEAAAAAVNEADFTGVIHLPWDDRLAEVYTQGGKLSIGAAEVPELGKLLHMCGLSGSTGAAPK